jgi:hypothetical protein
MARPKRQRTYQHGKTETQETVNQHAVEIIRQNGEYRKLPEFKHGMLDYQLGRSVEHYGVAKQAYDLGREAQMRINRMKEAMGV